MNEFAAWVELVKNGGLALAVVILVVGGMRRWYIFGWAYEEMKKDRDEWKAYALRGVSIAERAVPGSQ